MTLPAQCQDCSHYDDGACCHPDPFPGVISVIRGEKCESFDYSDDVLIAIQEP